MSTNDEKISKLEKEKSDLEHEVLEGKIKGTTAQLMALSDSVHGRINDLEKKNDVQFSNINDVLQEIKITGKDTLKQATLTNSRVTKLENKVFNIEKDVDKDVNEEIDEIKKHTKIVRFMHKYPKVTIIVALMFYLFTIKEIRDLTFEAIISLWNNIIIKLFI